MQLDDLKKTTEKMTDAELAQRLEEIRANRRVRKAPVQKAKQQTEKKEPDLMAMFDKLPDSVKQELLKKIQNGE